MCPVQNLKACHTTLSPSICWLYCGSSPAPGTIFPMAPPGFLDLPVPPWPVDALPLPWIYGPSSMIRPSTPLAPSGSAFPLAPPQFSGTLAPPQSSGTLASSWLLVPMAPPCSPGPFVSPGLVSISAPPGSPPQQLCLSLSFPRFHLPRRHHESTMSCNTGWGIRPGFSFY